MTGVQDRRGESGLLARLRVAAGMTQEELAERAGLSVRSISDIERGLVARPRKHSLGVIANSLGLADTDRAQFIAHYRPSGATGAITTGLYAVPAQLPPDIGTFTGRSALLAQLSKSRPLATVDGVAGVGKTALAVRWAHDVRAEFPDGQLYLDLRGYGPDAPVETGRALEYLLAGLGLTQLPDTVEARSALLRSTLDQRRVLIILDNALNADQVRPLLPGSANCMTVVTSRNQLRGLSVREGAIRVTVSLLDPDEGLLLLRQFAGEDRVAADPAAASTIARACSGLPLALALAGDLAARRPLASVAAELAHAADRLDVLDTGDGDPATSLRAVFSSSYDALPLPEARFFRRLGLHPGTDFDLTAACRIAGVSQLEGRRSLGLLVGNHLVEELGDDRFRLHDLLRTFAAGRVLEEESAADLAGARVALYQWYLAAADAAIRTIRPRPFTFDLTGAPETPTFTDSSAMAWLDLERSNLAAVLRAAAATGPLPIAWTLGERLRRYHTLRQDISELVSVLEVALAAAEEADDIEARMSCHGGLAVAFGIRGDYERSAEHLDQQLSLARTGNWPVVESEALSNLGLIHHNLGRLAEAALYFEESLAIARRAGDSDEIGITIGNLGTLSWSLGDLDACGNYLHEALELAHDTADRVAEARHSTNLGQLMLRLGSLDEALLHARKGVDLSATIGAHAGESAAAALLAEVLAATGSLDEALHLADRAVTLAGVSGSPLSQANAHRARGAVHEARSDYPAALTDHTQSLDLAEGSTEREPTTEAHLALARTHLALGNLPTAETHARTAHATAHEYNLRLIETDALITLAAIQRSQATPAALESALAALALATTTHDPQGQSRATAELARLNRS
ncbi:tetratricopeptide repeat protein [Kribbella sp. NPDC051587]|uniref:tetratricopeptide repeat protein n=1 Tax=Kribbella sp. NPDC051587 TaxID=3364119 RepID=UPI0037A55519